MVAVLMGAVIGAVLGGLFGLFVKLGSRHRPEKPQWAFVGSPGRGVIFGAVVGIVFGMYFGGPYGWRPEEQSNVVPLTAGDFDASLEEPRPLIAVFYSDSCPTCHKYAPHVEQLADEYEKRVTVARINGEGASGLMARYDVKGYPTTICFANGTEADRIKGAVSLSGLRKRADALLKQQVVAPRTPEQPATPAEPAAGPSTHAGPNGDESGPGETGEGAAQ